MLINLKFLISQMQFWLSIDPEPHNFSLCNKISNNVIDCTNIVLNLNIPNKLYKKLF